MAMETGYESDNEQCANVDPLEKKRRMDKIIHDQSSTNCLRDGISQIPKITLQQ